MMMKRLVAVLIVAGIAAGGIVACGDSTDPGSLSLVGTWDFIGFSDEGVEAETTGTWVFSADGTLTVQGTVTYPGEPTEDISGSATYEQTGTMVVLTFGSDTTTWSLSMSGNVATLTQDEPAPANTITLRRR